ncbi:helix-turn-helix domain-containing protein [Corynebacterium phoceense]|uniref:helix-turn-helix domain-containing protein n=1 Tax=Corynebacterium phoceense TaxID=1686286 RepID=UPI003524F1FA
MRSRNSLGRVNARAQLKLVNDLRAIRQDSGRTIDEVAAALGVENDVIVAFEQGESNFTMSTLRRYAKAVGAELSMSAWVHRFQEVEPSAVHSSSSPSTTHFEMRVIATGDPLTSVFSPRRGPSFSTTTRSKVHG